MISIRILNLLVWLNPTTAKLQIAGDAMPRVLASYTSRDRSGLKTAGLPKFFIFKTGGFRRPVEGINMKKRNLILAILAVGLSAGPIASQAIADTQLIVHPGATDTQVFGINDHGDVVGIGIGDPAALPFVYASRDGAFTDIAPAAGFASTSVLGIDDAGNMVGSVDSLDGLTTSGFIRNRNGTYTFFDHPDAFSFTNPRAVNNKGLVSGFSDREDGTTVGFIYNSKTGTFTDIDTGASFFTIAHGINSKGEVVGNSRFLPGDAPCADGDFVSFGWLRSADGTVTYFRVNGQSTRARGINDAGSIVGAVNEAASGFIKGFKVQLDGSQCQSINVDSADLLQVLDFETTFPEGITNSGVIVGIANDFIGPLHGFIVTPR